MAKQVFSWRGSFLFNSKELNFVTLFLWIVSPRKRKLDMHMGNELIYCVYQNEAASAYVSLYFAIFLYWLTKETLQTFFANGSNRNVEMGYLLYSNKWIIATMLFASSIIVVYDWRFMRWRHLLKQHLMPLRLITWPILMQNIFHAFFHESW